MVPSRHRITARHPELDGVVTLELTPLDGAAVPARPGQFTMLWAFGVGEVPISYSGLPGASPAARHTIRAVGATTRALCDLPTGAVVGVRGPFGTSWPLPGAEGGDAVIVAGGIGLAPLRPLVEAVLAPSSGVRRVLVLLGARSPGQVLYRDELDRWRAAGAEVRVTVDAASPAWRGDVGVVTRLVAAADLDPDRTHAFVCGPEPMMRLCARSLVDRGVDPTRVVVSLERSMTCAVAHCGRCQVGPTLVCRDGPVMTWQAARPLLEVRER